MREEEEEEKTRKSPIDKCRSKRATMTVDNNRRNVEEKNRERKADHMNVSMDEEQSR
jgi:hypothetical protein